MEQLGASIGNRMGERNSLLEVNARANQRPRNEMRRNRASTTLRPRTNDDIAVKATGSQPYKVDNSDLSTVIDFLYIGA
jgi:hypothetical protein